MTTGFRAGTTTDQTVSLTGRWHRITTELNRYHLRPAGVGLHLLLDITIKSNQFKKQLHRKQLDKVGLFVKTFHLSSNRLQFRLTTGKCGHLWSFVVRVRWIAQTFTDQTQTVLVVTLTVVPGTFWTKCFIEPESSLSQT